jgi:uncharacterized membrane protein
VIVYAAIGAALYALFNWISFAIAIPGANNVSVRPHYGLLTFFGFTFGPIVGFLTGFVGNVVGDQLTGWGAFTSWPWSVANGLAGLIAGLFPIWMASRMNSVGSKVATAAVAGVVATIIGFLFIFVELVTQSEMGFNDPDRGVHPDGDREQHRGGHRDSHPGARLGADPGTNGR